MIQYFARKCMFGLLNGNVYMFFLIICTTMVIKIQEESGNYKLPIKLFYIITAFYIQTFNQASTV